MLELLPVLHTNVDLVSAEVDEADGCGWSIQIAAIFRTQLYTIPDR